MTRLQLRLALRSTERVENELGVGVEDVLFAAERDTVDIEARLHRRHIRHSGCRIGGRPVIRDGVIDGQGCLGGGLGFLETLHAHQRQRLDGIGASLAPAHLVDVFRGERVRLDGGVAVGDDLVIHLSDRPFLRRDGDVPVLHQIRDARGVLRRGGVVGGRIFVHQEEFRPGAQAQRLGLDLGDLGGIAGGEVHGSEDRIGDLTHEAVQHPVVVVAGRQFRQALDIGRIPGDQDGVTAGRGGGNQVRDGTDAADQHVAGNLVHVEVVEVPVFRVQQEFQLVGGRKHVHALGLQVGEFGARSQHEASGKDGNYLFHDGYGLRN